jgi:DNA-binding GntR family transcriptional regulator
MQPGMRTDTNPTLADKLAAAIADGILNGRLPPGERLDEVGPRRTARRVAHAGPRGAAPAGDERPDRHAPAQGRDRLQATPEEIESLFVAMAEMEATCARLAAMSMTPIERRRLQARHESMVALAAAGETEALFRCQRRLPFRDLCGAHNAPLADYAMNLRRRVGPYRRAQFRVDGRLLALQPGTRRRRPRHRPPATPPAPMPP